MKSDQTTAFLIRYDLLQFGKGLICMHQIQYKGVHHKPGIFLSFNEADLNTPLYLTLTTAIINELSKNKSVTTL
jgi:hypothetical protein